MLSNALALNPQGLDGLRFQATKDGGKESLRPAAQQFESYFLQLMLRSMRQTLSQDGPFDSQETRMFSDMFDQQVAQSVSQGKGLGLADMLVQQMQAAMEVGQRVKVEPRPYDLPPVEAASRPAAHSPQDSGSEALTSRNFTGKLWPHAADAAAKIGVSPHFLLAQAALESGWGKGELRTADGGNSYNLFNLKAGKGWDGKQVESETTEYVNGAARKQVAQFRAYDSYAEAFADYAQLLKGNPRYAGAVAQGDNAEGFARGLQAGGYATDPAYADKILRVINSTAFRTGLAASADS